MISGPVATMMLADQGAEVIKVEPPEGELVRHMGRNTGGLTSVFLSANRSKRSIGLDLKNPAAVDVLKQLIPTADVFVQNFRPGAIDRMGLGESVVRNLNASVIYVSISGFGETGPYAHKRVYDPVIQALSGLADIQMDAASGRPQMIRTIIPDKTTSVTAAQAITAALFHRERTGEGQHVKLAMLDTMVAYLWPEGMARYTFADRPPEPMKGEASPDLIYLTQDGYITAGAISDKEWQGMCRALDRPRWIDDERFRTANARVVHGKLRREMTAEVLLTRTSAEWLERLDHEEVPSAPVLGRHEVIDHPQIQANEMIVEDVHPVAGPIRQARPAARFDRTPARIRGPAPELGADTMALLGELGCSAAKIDELVASGAVVAKE
jgi:crotonobetainyl-CoA:carnitine CoA-transferase CaiB-like acyl-CoA transferase|tara:strand:+ start:205 stop:1350 length:1146 start_codon:yes stop_codon:yes gene_type:complete